MNCTSYDLPLNVSDPAVPSATSATMPTIVQTATSTQPSVQPQITATYLLQRLPQIVNPEPAVIEPDCGFTSWVNDNPFLAALGLGLLAVWVLGDKK